LTGHFYAKNVLQIFSRMRAYLIRRLLQSLLLLWGVLTLTFFLMHLSPGNPLDRYISPRIPPETIAAIRRQFGFDEPLAVQYYRWLRQWLRADWGYSLTQHRPVAEVLAEAIPATLQLTIPVLGVNFILGVLFGAGAAVYRHRWLGRLLSNSALAIYSMPGFWLGLMLILLFAIKLGWLPNSSASSLFAGEMDLWAACKDRLSHLLLPTLTLALPAAAATARYVRENLINVLESGFIRLAKAKGLSPWQIMARHVLVLVMALTSWMDMARLVRAEVMSLKERDFIRAAQMRGFSRSRIIFRHLLPNALSPVIAFSALRLADVILLESSLSFLGLGVQPPAVSWGSIIRDGRDVIAQAWWIVAFPGLAIMLTAMGLNWIGEGLRKAITT